MTEPVLLGGYATKRCPVRVHNDMSPAVDSPLAAVAGRPSPPRCGQCVRGDSLRSYQCTASEPRAGRSRVRQKVDAIAETVAAMDAGAELILGGWLPDDPAGGRTGRPDLLIGVAGGYLPGDVKNHRTVRPAQKTAAILSPLAQLASRPPVPALTTATSHRFEDGMQLAHYTRMLQACGRHPGDDLFLGTIIRPARSPSRRMRRPCGCWPGTTLPNPSYTTTHEPG